MARGKTLLALLDDLRAETRVSLNPAHNAQMRETQVKHLQRVQDFLYEDFDWPHLRIERQVRLQAGQRFYAVPDDMELERILHIEVRWGDRWCMLAPGIDACQYDQWDSDSGQQAWPVERWRIFEDERIEVWPVPSQDADVDGLEGTLKFTGIKRLARLVDDNDRAVLDNRLIVLYAAAEMLAAAGAKDAKFKLDQATTRYASLRGNLVPRRVIPMFRPGPAPRELRGPPRVHYRIVQP